MKKCGQRGQVTGIDLGREVPGVDAGEHRLRLVAPVAELLVADLDELHDAVGQVQGFDHERRPEVHLAGEPIECVFESVIFFLGPVAGAHAPQNDLAVQHFGALIRFDNDAAVREVDRKRLRFLEAAPGAGTHQRADQARGELPVVPGKSVILGTAILPDRFRRRPPRPPRRGRPPSAPATSSGSTHRGSHACARRRSPCGHRPSPSTCV